MEKEMLIQKLESERSLVEFYNYKKEILKHLKGSDHESMISRKIELTKLPMSELREIGYKVGAKDSKKSELIEEIIEKEGQLNVCVE